MRDYSERTMYWVFVVLTLCSLVVLAGVAVTFWLGVR